MSEYKCGCQWDSGPYTYDYCDEHKADDPDYVVPVDPDTKAAMLAGLEQLRSSIFTGPQSWNAVPYKRLAPLAERACVAVQDLSLNEVLLLGALLAGSARTQLQNEADAPDQKRTLDVTAETGERSS